MVYFQNFTGQFVAKGYTIGDKDFTQIRNNLYRMKTFQYSSSVDVADRLECYDNQRVHLGTFIVRDLHDPVYNRDMDIWEVKNILLEKI